MLNVSSDFFILKCMPINLFTTINYTAVVILLKFKTYNTRIRIKFVYTYASIICIKLWSTLWAMIH